MLDLSWIRNNVESFKYNLTVRNYDVHCVDEILALDEERKKIVTELNKLREMANLAAKEKKIIPGKALKEQIKVLNCEEVAIVKKLNDFLLRIPNVISDKSPIGKDSSENKEIKVFGETCKRQLSHDVIMDKSGLQENTKELSGSRFVALRGFMARLEFALCSWMFNHNVQAGFDPVSVPFIVNKSALYNSGQLPKFEDEFFSFDDKALIPTGEVPLVNIVENKNFDVSKLPIRMTTLSSCFRKEAGSAGRDTKGLIRLHQFQKVEIVSVVHPDESEQEHLFLLNHSEMMLQKLGLPYRVLELCSGDMGFTAHRQFDLEVWMGGSDKYVEVASCSNCTDFQARRMNAKVTSGNTKVFLHTLNCSALPIGRTLAAIIENNTVDGIFTVPKVLVDYIGVETYKWF
ncbi:MAG: serine--tRNA ligase [Alphaproteobacteria bacterium]|nr:MAG: serine--tRNA ligase [Alphaproteobacteria bacterium]